MDAIKVSFANANFELFLIKFCSLALESAIKSTDIDYSLYTTKTLTPDFKIHWRILKEQKEIEMVLVVNGTSWVGFGWRPKKLTAECRKFPVLHDIGYEASAEPEPSSAEPTSEPSSEPSSAEPSAEVASEPEPTAEVASEPEPTAEVASEPAPETASEPAPEVASKKAEQLTAASSKSKRVAAPQSGVVAPQIPSSKDEYTVSTSVSYRVSSVAGRRKRAVEKGKIKFPIELISLLTRGFTLPFEIRRQNFIQSHTT